MRQGCPCSRKTKTRGLLGGGGESQQEQRQQQQQQEMLQQEEEQEERGVAVAAEAGGADCWCYCFSSRSEELLLLLRPCIGALVRNCLRTHPHAASQVVVTCDCEDSLSKGGKKEVFCFSDGFEKQQVDEEERREGE
ncbi:hypothetical protein ACSSS7_001137 [Eimeria intestinalis]